MEKLHNVVKQHQRKHGRDIDALKRHIREDMSVVKEQVTERLRSVNVYLPLLQYANIEKTRDARENQVGDSDTDQGGSGYADPGAYSSTVDETTRGMQPSNYGG